MLTNKLRQSHGVLSIKSSLTFTLGKISHPRVDQESFSRSGCAAEYTLGQESRIFRDRHRLEVLTQVVFHA